MALYIYTANPILFDMIHTQIQNRRTTDSGFDIPMLETDIDDNALQHTFNLEIVVAATMFGGERLAPCLLVPRSSLSGSPFRLANSIGLIDQGYRGQVKAKVDILGHAGQNINVPHGTRYFQICQHNFLPWERVELVQFEHELPQANDTRGAGGFGSTGQ